MSSPAMAGVMALINQKAGAPQGSPNTQLYQLAAKQSYGGCSAESVTAGNTSCYFNDIDTGTIAMPCDYGAPEGGILYTAAGQPYTVNQIAGIRSPNCTPVDSGDTVAILSGYGAGTGYDQATGLGSLNVANVVNAWISDAGTGASTVTVTPPTATITINNSLTLTVAVAGSGRSQRPPVRSSFPAAAIRCRRRLEPALAQALPVVSSISRPTASPPAATR